MFSASVPVRALSMKAAFVFSVSWALIQALWQTYFMKLEDHTTVLKFGRVDIRYNMILQIWNQEYLKMLHKIHVVLILSPECNELLFWNSWNLILYGLTVGQLKRWSAGQKADRKGNRTLWWQRSGRWLSTLNFGRWKFNDMAFWQGRVYETGTWTGERCKVRWKDYGGKDNFLCILPIVC